MASTLLVDQLVDTVSVREPVRLPRELRLASTLLVGYSALLDPEQVQLWAQLRLGTPSRLLVGHLVRFQLLSGSGPVADVLRLGFQLLVALTCLIDLVLPPTLLHLESYGYFEYCPLIFGHYCHLACVLLYASPYFGVTGHTRKLPSIDVLTTAEIVY